MIVGNIFPPLHVQSIVFMLLLQTSLKQRWVFPHSSSPYRRVFEIFPSVNCCFPGFAIMVRWCWSLLYQVQQLPIKHVSPLNATNVVQGKCSPIQLGTNVIARGATTKLNITSDCFGDSSSRIILRVDSQNLSYYWIWLQGSGVLNSEFPFS